MENIIETKRLESNGKSLKKCPYCGSRETIMGTDFDGTKKEFISHKGTCPTMAQTNTGC